MLFQKNEALDLMHMHVFPRNEEYLITGTYQFNCHLKISLVTCM